ncbi:MAG TPA: SEFIR domain-containing protein [Longimicrobium sp.]|nr:SEFIR domain-containing protein [Longimicrobium sp.]
MSDYDPHTHPERVLISYSHDSPAHQARVLELARRLREDDGVFVMLDQYAPHPAEGWPQWMRREIEAATHVLIVCTEMYLRRVNLRETPGRGLGATWEGNLVILATYAAQGFNDKFIPVVFSASDQAFVPDFLQGVTRYDVSTEQGYEQLHARLTGQQLVRVPPLGPRRTVGGPPAPASRVAPAASTQTTAAPGHAPLTGYDLVLIETQETKRFIPAERIREQNSRVEFTLAPDSPEDSAFLSELKGGWHTTRAWIAYGDAARQGTVEAADRSRDASGERWTVTVALEEDRGGNITEMGTTGKSADDIAELRARRILLNEKPPADFARWGKVDSTLEMLVQGLGSSGRLTESPIPPLYRQLGSDVPLFLAAARLLSVLELRRTETVQHILDLELQMEAQHLLRVRFRGRRRKTYTNMPAHEIVFEGVCQLE